jgi:hypothetical protein
VTAQRHIQAAVALAFGLAFLPCRAAAAADPERITVLRSSPVPSDTGAPLFVHARPIPSRQGEDAATRASRLLGAHREALSIRATDEEFTPVEAQDVPGGSHVRFLQRHRGIEVHRGEIVLSMNRRGALTMVSDAHIAGVSVERIDPALSPADAIRLASASLQASPRAIGAPDRADLVIARGSDGRDRLAFRVWMTREDPPGDWQVLLDARSGDIISTEDRFVHHHAGLHADGVGLAYRSDPLSAARAVYGATGFVDGDDADTDSLRSYRIPLALDSLAVDNGLAWLRGPFCSIADIEAPYDSIAYARPAPYLFDYNRSEPGFEAVMAYHHAVQSLRRVESLGFRLPRLRSLRLDPHGFQGKDNSHYSPSGNWIGFGTGGVDDAEDADVIWHEYAHAINYTIVPGWGGGECAALGEGYADYWAGSFARSLAQWGPDDPQRAWTFKWDGHNEFWSGRILDDTRRYPFGPLSPHIAGQIWASALMDIHERVGRDVADRLVLKSMYYLSNGISARDAAYALLQADVDLFDGGHLGVLRQVLGTERGFLAPESGSTILVLTDELPADGDGSSVSLTGRSAAHLASALAVPAGFAVQVSPWDSFDPDRLFDAAVTVVLTGTNRDPLRDADRRRRLLEFVRTGGCLVVEGSGVATRMLADDVEPEFAGVALAVDGIAGPFHSDLLTGSDGRLFSSPHDLSAALPFSSPGDSVGRYGVRPVGGDPGVGTAACWSNEEHSAGIVTRTGADGGLQTVFFGFAFSTLSDSTDGPALLENAITALLTGGDPAEVTGGDGFGPEAVRLHQNYPNPFNPGTTLRFTLTKPQRATVRIYDLLGREVAVVSDEARGAGTHEVAWDATGRPSGVYLCQLSAGAYVQTVRMLLVK